MSNRPIAPPWLVIHDGEAKTFFGAQMTAVLFTQGALVFRRKDAPVLCYEPVSDVRDIYDTP